MEKGKNNTRMQLVRGPNETHIEPNLYIVRESKFFSKEKLFNTS